jgi:hypothetical protein
MYPAITTIAHRDTASWISFICTKNNSKFFSESIHHQMNSIFKTQIPVTSIRERRYLIRRVQTQLKTSDSSYFLNNFKGGAKDTSKHPN